PAYTATLLSVNFGGRFPMPGISPGAGHCPGTADAGAAEGPATTTSAPDSASAAAVAAASSRRGPRGLAEVKGDELRVMGAPGGRSPRSGPPAWLPPVRRRSPPAMTALPCGVRHSLTAWVG